MTQCVVCKNNFGEDVGMYNSPMGWVCGDCGESKPWLKSVRKKLEAKKKLKIKKLEQKDFSFKSIVEIGGFSINGCLLEEYVKKVDYLRRATKYSMYREDPLILQKALEARKKIHIQIFRSINLPYHVDSKNKKSQDFNSCLDEWIGDKIKND